MISARKEHSAMLLNNYVFAVGGNRFFLPQGYDGNAKEMLDTVERYDI